MKPNLKHHTKQKYYVAIFYSLVFHFFLFVFLVNYSSISVDDVIGNFKKEFLINESQNKKYDMNEMEINELYLPYTRNII
ncbi:MAG: hypothetical protein ISS16_10600 [Ignavibacteria bacterium]|nr:hypothetical protein [Ignavibacteria bacterium]